MVSSHGQFVWYELMTTDMQAAKAFYTSVVGWVTQDASMPGVPYALFISAKSSVAGLTALPLDADRIGAKPRWLGYVAVEDVDAAAVRVKQLGGVVYVEPTNIPGISRFAVVADPQMAIFVLVKWLRARTDDPTADNAAGRIRWRELFAAERETAFAFYRDLFAWQDAGSHTGSMGPYQLFSVGGQTIGSVVTKPAAVSIPLWLYYFSVDDVDAATKRVKAGGGQILGDAFQVAEGGWIVTCADPQGALFALIGPRRTRAVGYFERVSSRGSGGAPGRWSW